jgi:hypothetical protein
MACSGFFVVVHDGETFQNDMEAGRQFMTGLAASVAMGNLIGYWSAFNLGLIKKG